ncbi:LytR C-terminal domain-containing protein [Nocardioides donggukensis]|uniref:LytR C-terminal domain-containing protein n=1 Tax=Nocardioides donggukensis TaxID=2774019 RepID=A0A927KBL9_9ACTN|nr:LytR C-terminal domain-containing protein [Nocardioides donggukensis]MBD8871195.1 LytR C-terminal domain-containing protein [Nocardioides donggukensis]
MDRRAVSAITLGVLVMLCLVAVLLGFRALTAELPDDPIASEPPVCEDRDVDKGEKVRPRDVVVSVFNAGSRAGQASKISNALENRGFVPAERDNAPRETGIVRAQVWVDGPVNPAARLVATHLGKGTPIKTNKDALGPGIMVLVGDDLGSLPKGKRKLAAKKATSICSPPADVG